ncbi:magnesium transporter [Cerasicoccus arenae]|uniref:Magnesium transporter MgtE n=1 Tax=Cerasicoccus arenae TaxID=424488 RepID=A0A8J3DD05_9BACT|nr:magnesium transporter [Cerasicoccus arenae]MBK1857819.1 magnesium transporter [Cerasicoccus arenae]GHC11692.1 magnesium transporter MgtE [Cerasicoccus arenae]
MSQTEAPFPESPASSDEYSLDDLLQFAESNALNALDKSKIARTSPYTVGKFLTRLPVDDRRVVLRLLNIEGVAEVLSEMDSEDAAEVIEAMRQARAVKVLEALDPDDSADIVGDMEEANQHRLLNDVNPERAETVRTLISYPEDSAGGIMTTDVATVPKEFTVRQTVDHLHTLHDEFEHIYYVYVIDKNGHLLGTVSMRDLVMAKTNDIIGDIMHTELRGVLNVLTDQEDVTLVMAQHNFHALPVVDDDNRLLGMITDDDVIDIIQQEATEDFQKAMGAGGDESLNDPIAESVRRRSPWLLVNLLSAFMAGGVISLFEEQISHLTILAVCMPIVASLGGNAGGQTLAIVIRTLALGDFEDQDARRVLIREATKACLSGIIVGLIAALAVGILGHHWDVSAVIFVAMIISMSYAGLAGALIPITLRKLKLDPAQSSQMFLTASTDIVGFAVFLGLGSWVLL